MGIAEPLLHAFDFTDTLAQIGTIVNNVDSLLKAEEQNHPDKPVEMNNHGIMLKNVSFSYDGKTEILHDVTATVPEGGITAIGSIRRRKVDNSKADCGILGHKAGRTDDRRKGYKVYSFVAAL